MAQTFLLCAVSLLTLILIGRGLQLQELFLGLDFAAADIALLFIFMMPLFLLMVLPVSCMLGVFLTFLRMSTDRELVALRAGGVSIFQMLRAPAVFSLICMGLAVIVSLHGISWGMSAFRSTVLHIASTRAKVVIQPGVFNQDILAGLTLFAREVDQATGRLRQIVFEDTTGQTGRSVTILAPEGELMTDESRGELVFRLENGNIYRMDNQQLSILHFDEYLVRLDLSSVFQGIDLGDVKPKELSWDDLNRAYAERGASEEWFYRKVDVERHKRWALPVACLVLGLFAVPLAFIFDGLKRQLGVVLSLIMFLVYYSIFSVGLNAGESGVLRPAIGLWMANAIFAVMAALGVFLSSRERVPTLNGFARRCKEKWCTLVIGKKS